MDNLPFLSQSQQQQSGPLPQISESDEPQWRQAYPASPPPSRPDMLDSIKSNPMALVLVGIVIGAILMNMRPVIIKSA
jgi:hypothetical protein